MKSTTKFIILLMLCASVSSSAMFAQQAKPVKSISIEALGSSTLGGFSFDSRISGGRGFGYRVGLAYSLTNTFPVNENYSYDVKGISAPVEINYLFKKSGNSALELAFGINLGIYNLSDSPNKVDFSFNKIPQREEKNVFSYNNYINVGYRYEKPNGLLFRVGLTNSFSFNDNLSQKHSFKVISPWPYIGVGYSF